MEPSGPTLLRLEQQARRAGTGLEPTDLRGRWDLQQMWPKSGGQPSTLSSQLLRALVARLEIDTDDDGLLLSNAVTLGPFELRFRGRGALQGRRPLLVFGFDQLELSLAGRRLLQRNLPAADPRRRPFFALIHRNEDGWLAARGRGGGLALWRLAGDPGLRR